MTDTNETNKPEEGKFNAAVDTLMKISGILDQIVKISTQYFQLTPIQGITLTAEQSQHIKHRLVKMLLIRASPLIPNQEKVNELYNKILEIKLKYRTDINPKTGMTIKQTEVYDSQIDIDLDKLVLEITAELQKGKYFMPGKGESRLF